MTNRIAITAVAATGGSTNAVLHLLAMAHEAEVELSIDDFQTISAKTPLLLDLKPAGRFVAVDVDHAGGWAVVAKRLCDGGYVHRDCMTVTGRTFAQEASDAQEKPNEVIRPLSNPIKSSGGLFLRRVGGERLRLRQSTGEIGMRVDERALAIARQPTHRLRQRASEARRGIAI